MRDLRRRCEHCAAVIPEAAHPRRIYCDTRCKNAALNGLIAQARRDARSGRRCEECGAAISDDRKADTRLCTDRCAWQSWDRRRRA
ncbi:MAG: hypothetical protein AAF416_18595 [Pseudomonadota bacterium]